MVESSLIAFHTPKENTAVMVIPMKYWLPANLNLRPSSELNRGAEITWLSVFRLSTQATAPVSLAAPTHLSFIKPTIVATEREQELLKYQCLHYFTMFRVVLRAFLCMLF